MITVKVETIALSYNDDKCFIMDDNIDTLTQGHHKIKLRNYKIKYQF